MHGERETSFRLQNIYCTGCADAVEQALRANPHITGVRLPAWPSRLYPSLGIALAPEWSALLMSLSSIIVAVNAVLLKRVEGDLDLPAPGQPPAPLRPAPAA
jgi:cation transport ATPase